MLATKLITSVVLGLTATTQVYAYLNYTTVTGYFLQDDPSTNATTFNFTATNFGLINRTYPTDSTCDPHGTGTQWSRFACQVDALNKAAPSGVSYRVLYMGRHGDGFHNDAEAFYGTPAWNCYYSELDGNATVTWSDAHLSPAGVTQAKAVNAFWAHEIATQKIPVPQVYYTSPLTRCLQTANYSFHGLDLPPGSTPFIPEVKELFRESISGHTCDRRSSKTYIHENFPSYTFEAGFVENDELWEALHGETTIDQEIRSRKVLDSVFAVDHSTYVSITSHSGEIGAILTGKLPTYSPLSSVQLLTKSSAWPSSIFTEYRYCDPCSGQDLEFTRHTTHHDKSALCK